MANARRDPTDAVTCLLLEAERTPDTSGGWNRRIQSCQQALALLNRNEQPKQWATIMYLLGSAYVDCPFGDKAANQEAGIHHLSLVLENFSPENEGELWSGVRNSLAKAFRKRVLDDRSKNLEEAIQILKDTAAKLSRVEFPDQWAETMTYLGDAYRERLIGAKEENRSKAAAAYELALEIRTKRDMPQKWAKTAHSLAGFYANWETPDAFHTRLKAIELWKGVLDVWTQGTDPEGWASVNAYLGNAFMQMSHERRAQDIECAIEAYQNSLKVWEQTSDEVRLVKLMNNLATAYSRRVLGDPAANARAAESVRTDAARIRARNTDFLRELCGEFGNAQTWEDSLALVKEFPELLFDEADVVFKELVARQVTREAKDWIQLHRALLKRIREIGADAAFAEENLTGVKLLDWLVLEPILQELQQRNRVGLAGRIELQEKALTLVPRAEMELYAQLRISLGLDLGINTEGDIEANLERAIEVLSEALTVISRAENPALWWEASSHLGTCYLERIIGSRQANLQKAIELFTQALDVVHRDQMPVEWAQMISTGQTPGVNSKSGIGARTLSGRLRAISRRKRF